MGFLQSVTNQIGRELGRDIYHSVKKKASSLANITPTDDVKHKISTFKLAQYEKVTVRNLNELVDKVAELTPLSSYELELYFDLDEKIDFCKEALSDKFLVELEELDKRNLSNYKLALAEHKGWVQNRIDNLQKKVDNYVEPNKMKLRFSNIFAYILAFLLVFVVLSKHSFKKSNLKEKLGEQKYTELVNIINSENLISEDELKRNKNIYDTEQMITTDGNNFEHRFYFDSYFDYNQTKKIPKKWEDGTTSIWFTKYYKPNKVLFNKEIIGYSSLFYGFIIMLSIFLISSVLYIENKISNQIKDNNNNIDELGKFKKYKEVL
jgi:hypothetical protein